MNHGDLVKFKNPTEDEINDRFYVVELRGNRVLVQDAIGGLWVRPEFVYLTDDLEKVQS